MNNWNAMRKVIFPKDEDSTCLQFDTCNPSLQALEKGAPFSPFSRLGLVPFER